MVDDDVAALARCVGDVETFAHRHWGREPLVRRDGGSFDDLLSVSTIEGLLVHGARRPTFRLVRDGVTIPFREYTRSLRLGGIMVDDVVDPALVNSLVGGGATVVMQSLQHVWPPLERFCRRLERATSHPVQANAYLSPAGSPALNPHRDTHHVLALQLEGCKTWHVDGLGSVVLDAGDVVYIPAGTTHSALAEDTFSLHLTIGVLAVTTRHVVQRLVARLTAAETARPLPLGFAHPDGHGPTAAVLSTALDELVGGLTAVSLAELTDEEVDRAITSARPPTPGTLRAVVDPQALEDHVRLRRRPGLPLRLLADSSHHVVIEFGARQLRLPASALAAARVVADRTEFTVGELGDLDRPSRVVLARRLLREGIVGLAEPGGR